MLRQQTSSYFLFVLSLGLYAFMAYGVARHQTVLLLTVYGCLLAGYVWMCTRERDASVPFWYAAAFIFRAALLFAVPNLSDDFYRFVWDGRLLAAGHHPFADVPSAYMNSDAAINGINSALYERLNSKDYFTVYPPLAQFIFWLSAILSPHSVFGSMLVIKCLVLAAEAGSCWLLIRLLKTYGLPAKNGLLYALNPLVIVELAGNIHFEAFLIFFVLASLYALSREKLWLAALAFAGAVTIKLWPVIWLPLLIRKLGWRKAFTFYGITGVAVVAMFASLFDAAIVNGLRNGLGYYFQKFEFNASLYYVVRAVGTSLAGFNIIQVAGPVLALVATLLIFLYALSPNRRKISNTEDSSLFRAFMWILLLYFAFTTTLHPWYIAPLVMLAVFTPYRFALVWSGLIFLTYAGYTATGFHENLWLVCVEYSVVIGYLGLELKRKANNFF